MQDLPTPVGSGDDSRVAQPIVGSTHKEELISQDQPLIEEINPDVEMTAELIQAGVQKRSETIDLPPDVASLGVSGTGPAQPLPTTVTIQLPLSDEQIETGLHAKLTSSIRWLAEWCIFRLKKLHIHLKVIAGRIVRQPV